MVDDGTVLPPRGWYPDPAGTPAWRWWDGARWTNDLHDYVATTSVPGDQLEGEEAMVRRLIRVGIPLFIVVEVLSTVVRIIDTSYFVATIRWFRDMLPEIGTPGFVATGQPQPPLIGSLLNAPATIGFIVFLVLLLTAQHKMASVARALGIRGRLSPTWGIIGWFIPFANVVLPLLAWHDLVPHAHPLRRQISWLWAAYLASGAMGILALVGGFASLGLVIVGAVLSLGLHLVVAAMLPSILNGIVAHHAAAAGTSGQTATSDL